MTSYVYLITNKINGKMKVGKANKPNERWKQHKTAGKSTNSTEHLYRAMLKYGIDNFIFKIIEKCISAKEAFIREIFWIAELGTTNPAIGYNKTTGGDGICAELHITQETKEKMSKSHMGKKASPETLIKKSLSAIKAWNNKTNNRNI